MMINNDNYQKKTKTLYSLVNSNDTLIKKWGCEMLKIKEFSNLCKCSVHTLRYYDEIGLLKPLVVDDKSHYRFYKKEQVLVYMEIKQFQEIGFSIQEIKLLCDMDDDEIVENILKKIDGFENNIILAKRLIHKDKYGINSDKKRGKAKKEKIVI